MDSGRSSELGSEMSSGMSSGIGSSSSTFLDATRSFTRAYRDIIIYNIDFYYPRATYINNTQDPFFISRESEKASL